MRKATSRPHCSCFLSVSIPSNRQRKKLTMFKSIFSCSFSIVACRFRNAIAGLQQLSANANVKRACVHISLALIPIGALTMVSCADGDEYLGDKRNGIKHGKGTMTYKDGSTYSGEWKDGKRNGDGTLFTPDGTVFECSFWTDDVLDLGTIKYPNGDVYIGSIENYKPHGKGIIFYADGPYCKYQGYFKEGKYCGKGVLYERATGWTWWKKRVYDGTFREGKRHGFMLTRDMNDIVIAREIWENDKPVRKLE